jgi:hypothetical protein
MQAEANSNEPATLRTAGLFNETNLVWRGGQNGNPVATGNSFKCRPRIAEESGSNGVQWDYSVTEWSTNNSRGFPISSRYRVCSAGRCDGKTSGPRPLCDSSTAARLARVAQDSCICWCGRTPSACSVIYCSNSSSHHLADAISESRIAAELRGEVEKNVELIKIVRKSKDPIALGLNFLNGRPEWTRTIDLLRVREAL